MKIALITGTFFPYTGGVQIEVHNNANKLIKKGNDVDVYVNKSVSLRNNKYRIIKLEYFCLSILFFLKFYLQFDPKKIFSFFNFNLINLDYDIYHFHFLNFKSLILIDFLKFHKKKIIVTFHGADIQIEKNINYGFRLNKRYDFYLKKIIKKIDCFQSISKNITLDLKKLGIKKEKIFFISNSVNLDKFKLSSKKTLNKTIKLITVGRYAKYKKGFDLLPLLGKKLVKKKVKFQWKIIGENSHKLNNEKFINENKKLFYTISNIKNDFEIYLPGKKLISHYSSSNLYINLARVESFGLTFVEALASGLPILSFNTKGINEILNNNKNGFFLRDLDSFVNKILLIQKNSKKYFDMVRFSHNSAKRYDLNKNVLKLEKLYNQFINKKI
jgi:glycosyltransferase involved in cell wall biosynthesis